LIRVPNAILSYCVLTTEFRGILDMRELHSANLYIIFLGYIVFVAHLDMRPIIWNKEGVSRSQFSSCISWI